MKELIENGILARYFEKTASVEELKAINKWLSESAENEAELLKLHKIWRHSTKATFAPNKDAAWEKIDQKINQKKSNKRVYWLAAAIAGIALSIFGLLFNTGEKELLSLNSEKETITQTLEDGSVVTMNSYSHFEYPERFEDEERRVKLTGEAFFEISKNPEKPFIIEANGTEIKVLGTSFNINARGEDVSVSVNSGKVQFGKKERKKVILVKGEEAKYESKADTIKTAKLLNKNLFAYKTRVFEFNNSNIEEVVDVLNKGYKADIYLKGANWSDYVITTKFENQKLDDALDIIAETLNLNVDMDKKAYILTKNSEMQ